MQLRSPEAAAQLNHAYAKLSHRHVQAASVREAAGGATAAVAAHVQPRNVAAVVPYLLDGMAPACAWQTKVVSAHHAAPAGVCSTWEGMHCNACTGSMGCLRVYAAFTAMPFTCSQGR